ncbi:MAG: hypothetical protein KAG19_00635 [Methylococcales bacterium]|nr:hypothetical protein [Methylococcales bacterium]
MTTMTETFDGCEITIEGDTVTINSRQIDCEYSNDSKKYSTSYLPYSDYSNLLTLAKDVIRNTVEFTHLNT